MKYKRKKKKMASSSTTPVTSAVSSGGGINSSRPPIPPGEEHNDWEDLAHNSPYVVPPVMWDTIWGEFCNNHGIRNNYYNKLNLFIAFSSAGTSNVANFDIAFNGGALRINVRSLMSIINARHYNLRQFARTQFVWYQQQWTNKSSTILDRGGESPASVDFDPSKGETQEERLQRKVLVASTVAANQTAPPRLRHSQSGDISFS